MRIFFSAIALAGQLTAATAQMQDYSPLSSGDFVQDKNFYLLTSLQEDLRARGAVNTSADLRRLGDTTFNNLTNAVETCERIAACYLDKIRLSDNDIEAAGTALAALADERAIKALIRDHLRPSGRFQKYAGLDNAAFLKAAWSETAAGVGRLYRIYGYGEEPRYAAIDASSFPPDQERFGAILAHIAETALDGASEDDLFFDIWLRFALDVLMASQRDEAGRYEPLDQGENAVALAYARTVNWSEFPYAAILAPGAGLRGEERGLSAIGILRNRLAVRRFREGLAPFVIVSGGHVHPNKTPFNEAIEMKRDLIETHNIPEQAILIDPHARHTTTNLRNAARLIFKITGGVDKPMLLTTSRSQSAYVESETFQNRCIAELGYQPMAIERRLSPHDLVLKADIISLHVDPSDPLDP